MLNDDLLNVYIFQQRLMFAHCSNIRYNSQTQKHKIMHQYGKLFMKI